MEENELKTRINDLLLKMQAGDNCIGETCNKILFLFKRNELEDRAREFIKHSRFHGFIEDQGLVSLLSDFYEEKINLDKQ